MTAASGRVIPAPPPASSDAVRAVMVGNRKRDTRPKRALRSALHARGLRFRTDLKIGSGRSAPRPDIALTRARVAVFMDGCFWHGCPEHGVQPTVNSRHWSAKLARNRERDTANTAALEAEGWRVIRVWEHDDSESATTLIEKAVRSRATARLRQAVAQSVPA